MQVGFGGDKWGQMHFVLTILSFKVFSCTGEGGVGKGGGGSNAHSQVTSTYMYRQPGYGSRNLGS